jgi:hypothetical protein
MAEYSLDTRGTVKAQLGALSIHIQVEKLDDFDRGYIEAMFFTEHDPGRDTEAWLAGCNDGTNEGSIPNDVGVEHLSPRALGEIIEDCRAFKLACVHVQPLMGTDDYPEEAQAGRDFWYTRNGHGCGFWDGDWPEPHASDMTSAAKSFGEVSVSFDGQMIHID